MTRVEAVAPRLHFLLFLTAGNRYLRRDHKPKPGFRVQALKLATLFTARSPYRQTSRRSTGSEIESITYSACCWTISSAGVAGPRSIFQNLPLLAHATC